MREAREATLARRLSNQIPKSLPSSPQQHHPLTASSVPASVTTSPDRAFNRMSLQQDSGGVASSPSLDHAASRKKTDFEQPETAFAFQRDILATSASRQVGGMVAAATGTGAGDTATTSSTSSAPGLPQSNGASHSSHSGIGTGVREGSGTQHYASTIATSASSHTHTGTNGNSGARNTPPISASGAARTPLGSIVASSLGFGGSGPNGAPSSPTSTSSRQFRYPSIPSSTPPPSSSTSPSSTLNSKSNNNNHANSSSSSAGTTESSKHLPPLRKSSLMNDSSSGTNGLKNEKLGGGGSSGGFHTPSVFINIGRTSTSLPQILMPKKRVAQNIVSNLTYIAAWYFFSTALSIYNKNLMGKDNWNFNLPLFVSSIHAGLHFVITACLMHFFPDDYDATRSGKGGRLTIHSYVTQVVPCAIAAALEICMANASLMYITLSFYTMIKSSTPIWVLIFAFFFRLEKPRMSLILIIGIIVIGVVLTVAGETQFDMTGFVLVLLAAVMSGLRWSLTQMLLQKDQLGMDNPVATLYYISPIMFVIMSLLSLIIEDPFVQFTSSEFFNDFRTGMLTMMMAGGGGFLAFAMTVAEFKLIKNTGTVTLSVAGISKEIVVISLSMLIFGDRLTLVNLLGLMVSIGGIMAYNYDKVRKLQQNTHGSGDYEALGAMGRHHKGDNTD